MAAGTVAACFYVGVIRIHVRIEDTQWV